MNPNQYQISMRPAFEPEAVHIEPFNPIGVLMEALGGTPPLFLKILSPMVGTPLCGI